MKRIALLSAVAAAFVLGAPGASALTPQEYETIQRASSAYLAGLTTNEYYDVMAEDVAKRIQGGKGDFLIVDVRVPKDKKYDQGRLPGAIYIGVMDLAKPESLAKLPRDKDIIVYCDTGQQQNKAVTVLRLLGYKAYAMKWGYMAWKVVPPTAATLSEINNSITKNYPVEK